MSVVVGYIPTPEGEAALRAAIDAAADRDAELVIVNTSRGDATVDPRYADEAQLGTLEATLAESGVRHRVEQQLRGRDAAEEILDAAERHRADLVVIGLRRRTAVGKLLMGSTAQRVLLDSHCPVLSVKP